MDALGRGGPDWRAVHGCPACSYEVRCPEIRSGVRNLTHWLQVEGEEPPTWARMIVLDGNNSLKRMAMTGGRTIGDVRVYDSDYYLAREFVNDYANEVRSRQVQAKPDILSDSDHDDEDIQRRSAARSSASRS